MGHVNYWLAILLYVLGLYTVLAHPNLIKKVIGLGLFQSAVIFFYVSMGKVSGGTAPIIGDGLTLFSNPIPHVLMLTAIVVGVATSAVALAIIVRIQEVYGSIEEDEIIEQERL